MKRLLVLLLTLAPLFAWATDRYVCNCGTGQLTGQCTNGATGNAGTSPASPKQTVTDWRTFFSSTSAAGDRVLLCRGGAWTAVNTDGLLQNTAATSANPITLGAYTPSSISQSAVTSTTTAIATNGFTDSTKSFGTNAYAGYGVEARNQWGALEYHIVASNTATTVTFADNWIVQPTVNLAYTMQAPRPILAGGGTGDIPLGFNANGADGNYIVEDISVQGTSLFGIFLSGSVHDVRMRRLELIGAATVAVHCGTTNDRFQLLDSAIHDNTGQGILWGCVNSLIQGNVLDNNALGQSGNGFHNLYIGLQTVDFAPLFGRNITVRSNTFTRNSEQAGACHSPSIIVHGQADGLTFENNLVWQSVSTASDGCYGIAVDPGYNDDEAFRGVVIRGNTVVNMGNASIGCASCIAPLVEDNVVVVESGTGFVGQYGIIIPDRPRNSGGTDAQDTGAVIRNNSIYFGAGGTGATSAISLGEYAGYTAGTSLQIVNNLIYLASGITTADDACYSLGDRTLANFVVMRENLCFHQGGGGNWSVRSNANNYTTLANAQASGWDLGGLSSDPTLVAVPSKSNNWSMKVQSGSPVINAGNTTYKAPLAIKGYKAVGARDIGAYEFGSNP